MMLILKQLFITCSLRCWLYSAQRDELLNGAYNLDLTLQNSSEDRLITVLLYGFKRFALYVDKDMVILTFRFLKVSERFIQLFFWPTICIYFFCLLIFLLSHFFISYCTRLTVSAYFLLEICVWFHPLC